MASRHINYPRISEKENKSQSLYILFESYRGTRKLSTLCGTLRVCVNSSFFGDFDDLEKSTV